MPPRDNDRGSNRERNQQIRTELRQVLLQLGLRPADFQRIIDKAVRGTWSEAQFEAVIYGSRPFKQRFPGIFAPDGSLKMTPAEYKDLEMAYQSTFKQHGLSSELRGNSKVLGELFGGNVSLQELEDRLTAVQRIKEFAPALEAFKKQVKENFGQTLKDKDIFDFVMGRGPSQFYALWEQANIREQAKYAGVQLSNQQIKKIQKSQSGFQGGEEYEARLSQLAQQVKSVVPLSEAAKFGITKRDLIELEFPGSTTTKKRRDDIGRKVEALLKAHQARTGGAGRARGQVGTQVRGTLSGQ